MFLLFGSFRLLNFRDLLGQISTLLFFMVNFLKIVCWALLYLFTGKYFMFWLAVLNFFQKIGTSFSFWFELTCARVCMAHYSILKIFQYEVGWTHYLKCKKVTKDVSKLSWKIYKIVAKNKNIMNVTVQRGKIIPS